MNVSIRNFFLVLTLILLSQSVFAEKMDYSKCHDFFDKARKNAAITGFRFPFDIDKTGNIVSENPRVNKEDLGEDMREYTWTTSMPQQTRHMMTVTQSEGQVVQIDYSQTNKLGRWERQNMPGLPEEMNTVLGFENTDGKCFPSYGSVDSTLFDAQFCYDIKKYFDKNSDVASCFDGDSKKNKEMLKVFSENGFDMKDVLNSHYEFTPQSNNYSLSVEQRIILANPKAAPDVATFDFKDKQTLFKLLGDTPLLSAHRVLMDCYEKGLGSTLKDSTLFEAPLNVKNGDAKSIQEQSETAE